MRKQRIATVSFLFLAVKVECERLTLAVIVLDHDFKRLSLGRECVIIEREFDLSNRQERGVYNLLSGVDGRFFVEEGESGQSR